MASDRKAEIPTTYAEDYYAANEQDGDRVALRWYAALVNRYSPPGRVLDFGCGTGWLVRRFLKSGSADGLEHSAYALAEAKRNNPSATFFADSAEIPASRYAALSCIHVVEHVPEGDLSGLFAEWRRILIKGGIVLVVTPDSAGRGAQIRGENWRGYDDPTHITLRSHAYWRAALETAGFEILAEGSDGLWDPPYGSWIKDRARLVPIAGQVLAGRLFQKPGSGESAVIIAKVR